MRVGLIGTGNMGNRFGPKLIRAGHDLTVYDLRRESATALCEMGAHWAGSPAAVAEAAEVVITSLPSPAAVESVALDPQEGVVSALGAHGVYIDMSTSTPTLANRIAEACRARGVDSLDAPLSSGGVYTTVGGDAAVFERCRPVLGAVSDHVIHVGGTGMGQVAKLVRQYVSFSTFVAELEALLIAAKAGANLQAVTQFLRASMGRSGFSERSIDSIFRRDFGTPETATATLDIVAKDLSLAVDLARQVQAPAQVGLAASDVLQRGLALGWGRYNFWAAVHSLEEVAGMKLEVGGGE